MDVVEAFRSQAEDCGELGSPMYADLLARVADDVEAGGPSRVVLVGYEDLPGPSALALRLAGSVHRLVLERRAGALAASYPSVGGTWEPEACWTAFHDLLAEQPDAVREWLDRPPQTNEVGRATALMGGLLEIGTRWPALPVRLFEIGSSGGLNLLADRYRYVARDGTAVGPADSPVVIDDAWVGPAPLRSPWPQLVDRVGSDLMPVDVATTEGRLTLTAYVWPDMVHRHERLRGALQVAATTPVEVRRQPAGDFVDEIATAEGAVTVLWHSVMWQYVEREEQERIVRRVADLGARATEQAPFVHLFLEPTRRTPEAEHELWLVAQAWPGGERRFLGRSRGHGVPTTWDSVG